MGGCTSKFHKAAHTIKNPPNHQPLTTSPEKTLVESIPKVESPLLLDRSKTLRNGVLPRSRKFDINYTTIPNKIHKKPSAWDNQVFGLVGLRNLGNTCFMNSALQCLLNVVPLTDYFLSELHLQEINEENFLGSKGEVTQAYASLVKEVWETNSLSEISPKEFYKAFGLYAPQFSYGTQEDSHDFIATLLDVIHEDLNRVKERPVISDSEPQGKTLAEQATNAWKNHLLRNRSIIVDLFQGQIKSSLKCHDCGYISYKFEPFMYLSLPIPEDSRKEISLYQCLDEFIKEEQLDEEERWHCSKCKAPKDSSKKIDIWTLPNVLIIHLKRFKFTRHKRGKIRSVVNFPIRDLNISNYLDHSFKDKPIYDLFAISCHDGTLGSGHYTSYAKNRDTSTWYFFNDNFVKEVENPRTELIDSSSYLLFYSKTTVDAFARQTISDPAAWPHYAAGTKRLSFSGSIMQSENSIMNETPMKFQKGSVRKIPKTPKRERDRDMVEVSASVGSVQSLKTHNGVVQKDLSGTHANDQTLHFQFNPMRDIRKSANNIDNELEKPKKIAKKRSKIKQVVVVLPKESTATPDPNDHDQSSIVPTERERTTGRTVVFKSTIKRRYEANNNNTEEKSLDPSMDAKEKSPVPRSQSYYQMNFSQEMNEQYQAKPIFGIHPKFKLAELKSQEKPSRNKI